jgi:CubicO group peptidase (beta-lactamase class C family)
MDIVAADELGLDQERLDRLTTTIKNDITQQKYDGAVVIVARSGAVALHEAIGFADRAKNRAMRTDDVFCLFSVTKTLTTAAVLQRIDRGELALTTRVADVIPEFGCKGKQRVTVAQLLTHTGGMSSGFRRSLPQGHRQSRGGGCRRLSTRSRGDPRLGSML